MEIAIKVIQFPEANPLPYVPAFCAWTDHISVCVQCAHADQLVKKLAESQGQTGRLDVDLKELERLFNLLCEGGMRLQDTVTSEMRYQFEISLRN
jgi:hypothetical protein